MQDKGSIASLNTLPMPADAGFESPSQEHVFILTTKELQAVIKQATEHLDQEIFILKDRLKAFAICEDRLEARIRRLEGAPINPSDKKKARLEKLDKLLVSRSNQAMTFSEVGKLLEIGSRSEDGKKNSRRQGMTKFAKILISLPDRYEVTQGKTVNAKLVKLTPDYYAHFARKVGQ